MIIRLYFFVNPTDGLNNENMVTRILVFFTNSKSYFI